MKAEAHHRKDESAHGRRKDPTSEAHRLQRQVHVLEHDCLLGARNNHLHRAFEAGERVTARTVQIALVGPLLQRLGIAVQVVVDVVGVRLVHQEHEYVDVLPRHVADWHEERAARLVDVPPVEGLRDSGDHWHLKPAIAYLHRVRPERLDDLLPVVERLKLLHRGGVLIAQLHHVGALIVRIEKLRAVRATSAGIHAPYELKHSVATPVAACLVVERQVRQVHTADTRSRHHQHRFLDLV